jgi:hypothetical protein
MATWGDPPDPAAVQLYDSWASAEARVRQLRCHAGIWPGIVRLLGGGCRLTYDPPVNLKEQMDTHGYLKNS